jgi:uncharacterized repeat protein (TIGR03803 family)
MIKRLERISTVRILTFVSWALSICAAATLADCGGSQSPLTLPAQGLRSERSLAQQTYHIIHPFGRSKGDGANPSADLIDIQGTLYGTTAKGGAHSGGTVFSITPSGKETVLYSFGAKANDGYAPVAALLNVNGTLYGTTSMGGGDYRGTVFTISTTGKYRRLYNFGSYAGDGQYPASALINVQGALYGTTTGGGDDSGTVYSISASGSEKVVYSFAESGTDGSDPVAALKNIGGILYGTTQAGGENNFGTVFKLTKTGEETLLHSFAKGEGVTPVAGVIAVSGTLYGTTYGEFPGRLPKRSFGNVYSLTP